MSISCALGLVACLNYNDTTVDWDEAFNIVEVCSYMDTIQLMILWADHTMEKLIGRPKHSGIQGFGLNGTHPVRLVVNIVAWYLEKRQSLKNVDALGRFIKI